MNQSVNYPHPHFITQQQYKPINTIQVTNDAIKFATGAGLLTVAAGNAVSNQKLGPLGIITKSGKLWGLMVLVAGTYRFSSASIANLREKSDIWNEFIAGLIAGGITAGPTKSLVKVIGTSWGTGSLIATIFWTGSFVGDFTNSSTQFRGEGLENKFEIKKNVETQGFWDVSRRRPLSQTLQELGQGAFKP
ncbi:hypothetical protein WICMUC_003359 [Wickerhamomyces mucosus]|uniref:NADH-ubiquinone oxidoreductase subunit B14.7 n=1 Tax=Wickerhamomyces mucosus TaxID=1378264 RepID=A0A9P8PLS6_9ASCO|nr:hypothetical protein WICMUC_003359 [Wickerhamomyces mucosus]